MKESPYWNPRHETMPRDQIEALQLRKLKNLVGWAEAKVPWQAKRLKAAGVSPDSIKSLKDLRRIPMMTRDEWMQAQLERPPYGPLLAAPEEAAIRYHLTSGTTGRIPLQVLDSMKDWEWIAEMWCYGFWGFGVRPADVVFFAFSYGTFVGFWGAHYASEKIWLPRAAGRQHDDGGPRQADHDDEGDRRLLDADLRSPDGAGGKNDGRRSGRRAGQATHPLGRAGWIDSRD